MKDIDLAVETLNAKELNFVLVKNGEVLLESAARGIAPILNAFKENRGELLGGSVADRVIGRTAALLLLECGVDTLYTDLISKGAVELLEDKLSELKYGKCVEYILNRTQDDLCPIEKIGQTTDDIEELEKSLDEFISAMRGAK